MIYRILIVLATIIWGSSFIIMKDVTGFMSPAWILFIRFFSATVILGFALLKYRTLYFKKDHVTRGLILGAAMFCAYYLQTVGLIGTTPGKNAFLTGVYCVLVPFFAWIVIKRKPNKFNLCAAALCILGVGLISLDGDLGMGLGDALTLGGAVFYALHITLVARFTPNRNVYVLTLWQFAGIAVGSALVAALTEQIPDWSLLPAQALPSLLYLTVVVTTLALLFQNIGQAHIPPASASLLLSLEAVFGVAFSVAAGAEPLTPRIVAGFALVFIAIIVSETLPEWIKKGQDRP